MAVHYWSVVYLFLLLLVIPTLKSQAATRHVTTRTCPLWTDISRQSSYFSSLFFAFRFRAFCVVVEFHSSHSFAILPWIVPHFRMFIAKLPTGFDVYNITVRFASCLLCCCRVSLQPQFRQFSVFSFQFSTGFVSKNLRSLCVVSAVLLLSFTPATVTFESIFVRFGVVFTVLLSSLTPATCSRFRRQGR